MINYAIRLFIAGTWTLLSACNRYPANEYECRMEAARAQTAFATRVALAACEEKFGGESQGKK